MVSKLAIKMLESDRFWSVGRMGAWGEPIIEGSPELLVPTLCGQRNGNVFAQRRPRGRFGIRESEMIMRRTPMQVQQYQTLIRDGLFIVTLYFRLW